MVIFFTANGLVQEQEVIDDVRILLSDLGIGAVVNNLLHGGLDGVAQLLTIHSQGQCLTNVGVAHETGLTAVLNGEYQEVRIGADLIDIINLAIGSLCLPVCAVVVIVGNDIQLLGIGLTGHIGFNEPADEFKKGTNCVDLDPKTIESNSRFFQSIDDVPKQAYTMGIQSILKSKKILLIANGEGKAEILYKACCGAITPHIPASVLQLHPDVVVVADDAALKVIKEKAPEAING